jgi:hypothetical protein
MGTTNSGHEEWEMAEETYEFELRGQVKPLAQRYFPRMTNIPTLKIQRLGDKEYEEAPAWLNAVTGTIHIDERVSTFQGKITKILILHELIHYQIYLDGHPNPEDENSTAFQSELGRIKRAGAYTDLL